MFLVYKYKSGRHGKDKIIQKNKKIYVSEENKISL